jgi:hypothetical protein
MTIARSAAGVQPIEAGPSMLGGEQLSAKRLPDCSRSVPLPSADLPLFPATCLTASKGQKFPPLGSQYKNVRVINPGFLCRS